MYKNARNQQLCGIAIIHKNQEGSCIPIQKICILMKLQHIIQLKFQLDQQLIIIHMLYDLKIANYEVRDNKVIYTICITDTSTHKFKIMKYRYSQLKDIHSELQQTMTKCRLSCQLPEFPKRKLFGATNKSQQAIIQRKNELSEYLNLLISIQKLYNLEIFKNSFLPIRNEDQPNPLKGQNSGTNVQMYIDRYSIVDDVVFYYSRISDLDVHQEWVFRYRYSDFRNLHEALEKSKIRFLPQFPKRKIFGITNYSTEDIEKRKQELERYFNEIFSSRQLVGNPILKLFIENTKSQVERQLQIESKNRQKSKGFL